jgi:hypothetical protein
VSGIFSFKYQVFDRTGASATATVSITLQPQSKDDPGLTATLGVPQVLDVLANDLGSPTDVTITQQPSSGNVATSGTTVTFTPASKGNFTFKYKYTDASGLKSPEATASVVVQAVSAPDRNLVAPYNTDATAPGPWTDITPDLLAGSPAGTQIVITQTPTQATGTAGTGSLRIDGVAYKSGTVTVKSKIEFQPQLNSAGEWTFPYALTVGGYVSTTGTVDEKVTAPPPPPTFAAVNDSAGRLLDNTTQTISVGLNDTPQNKWSWDGSTGTKVTLDTISANCGSWNYGSSSPSTGVVAINIPNLNRNDLDRSCTAKYTLIVGTKSSQATISYIVTTSP